MMSTGKFNQVLSFDAQDVSLKISDDFYAARASNIAAVLHIHTSDDDCDHLSKITQKIHQTDSIRSMKKWLFSLLLPLKTKDKPIKFSNANCANEKPC